MWFVESGASHEPVCLPSCGSVPYAAVFGACHGGAGARREWCKQVTVDSSPNNRNGTVVCSGVCEVPTLRSAWVSVCGDGYVTDLEDCDDGNSAAGDGCTACRIDTGFYCTGGAFEASACHLGSTHRVVEGKRPTVYFGIHILPPASPSSPPPHSPHPQRLCTCSF
jgi:cysteine-rich repeat protein